MVQQIDFLMTFKLINTCNNGKRNVIHANAKEFGILSRGQSNQIDYFQKFDVFSNIPQCVHFTRFAQEGNSYF